jgi:hypothetical protein
MKFPLALRRSQNASILYVSIGGNLPKSAPQERVNTQQLPLFLRSFAVSNPKKKVAVILVAPVWDADHAPRILDKLEGYWSSDKKHTFTPMNMDNITIRIIPEFFRKEDEKLLAGHIRKSSTQDIIVGDFTITAPFIPFDNFPDLGKAVQSRKNAKYINSRDDETKLR